MLSLASSASADAGRGQTLFNQFCSGCHVADASDPISRGAGNPGAIQSALQNVALMRIVRELLEPPDIVDIADYLAARFDRAPSPAPPPSPPPPPPPSPVTLLTAVEFHHAALDHYFVSANPAEIAALDAGHDDPRLAAHRRDVHRVADERRRARARRRCAASTFRRRTATRISTRRRRPECEDVRSRSSRSSPTSRPR